MYFLNGELYNILVILFLLLLLLFHFIFANDKELDSTEK